MVTAYHAKLECIYKDGKLPEAPLIDLEALTALMPKDKNPIAVMIFEQTVKSRTSDFETLCSILKTQIETYYNTLCQFGLSMQNKIKSFKDYAKAPVDKNPVWLCKAFQSVCMGNTSVVAKDSKMSTMIVLTGLKKNAKYESIHVYHERWKLSYKAYQESGNTELSEPEQP